MLIGCVSYPSTLISMIDSTYRNAEIGSDSGNVSEDISI